MAHEQLTPYKPGQSGNPKGKPKGSLNMSTMLRIMLNEKTKDEDGKKTTHKALIIKKVIEKAKDGNLKASEMVFDRTEGKPAQTISQIHEGRIDTKISFEDISDKELDAILRGVATQ
jgi:hypothetical protein